MSSAQSRSGTRDALVCFFACEWALAETRSSCHRSSLRRLRWRRAAIWSLAGRMQYRHPRRSFHTSSTAPRRLLAPPSRKRVICREICALAPPVNARRALGPGPSSSPFSGVRATGDRWAISDPPLGPCERGPPRRTIMGLCAEGPRCVMHSRSASHRPACSADLGRSFISLWDPKRSRAEPTELARSAAPCPRVDSRIRFERYDCPQPLERDRCRCRGASPGLDG